MTYTCEHCHGVFEQRPEWSDDDAMDEVRAAFGQLPSECVRVCEDCYQALMRAMRS